MRTQALTDQLEIDASNRDCLTSITYKDFSNYNILTISVSNSKNLSSPRKTIQ